MAGKPRKMLGSADAPYIVSLMGLIDTQSKKTIATWCLDYADAHLVPIYERRRPGDGRPAHAVEVARAWRRGEVRLPEVRKVIAGECLPAAREAEDDPAAQAAARAAGSAAACVHTPTHSLAVAFYGAAAIAYDRVGVGQTAEEYDAIAAEECAKMEAALRAVAVADEPNPAKINWNC
jgi:hypothetical protein